MLTDHKRIIDVLRLARARSVHVRNGLYLYDRGDLSFASMMARLAYLDEVADSLNERLRETLNWQSPAEAYAASVAMTD